MTAAFAFCCLAALASIEIELAPDQPLPAVYVVDPLIIELRSAEDTQAVVKVRAQAAHRADAYEGGYGPVPLHAGGSHWHALKDLPAERGYYTAQVSVEAGGAVTEKTLHFCRMDRSAAPSTLPLYTAAPEDRRALLALSALGIRHLRFDASQPELEQRLTQTARAGFKAVLFLDTATMENAVERAQALAKDFGASLARWEIDAHDDAERLTAISKAIRSAGCVAPISSASASPAAFQALMERQAGRAASGTVLFSDAPAEADLAAIRRAAEEAGHEGWEIQVLGRGVSGEASGPRLVQQLLRNLANGVSQTGFDTALVIDGEIGESFSYLNGLARRLSGTAFCGVLDVSDDLTGPVFEKGDAWMLALWKEGTALEAVIPLGAAHDLRLTDAFNNPIPIENPSQESLTISVDALPKYLSGVGGSVPGRAARNRVRQLAADFSGNPEFQKRLPQELMATVAAVASKPGGDTGRDQFLNLVRNFPGLEQQWHAGQLPRPVAVPAIACLARLVRALCTVEEDRGQPFLDPLQDTLARCKEFQSSYLTGSGGSETAHERGDWLLDEIRGLLDEAESLSTSGAKIEAAAVATLAEWRARSLEFAALQGPLSDTLTTDPPPVPASGPVTSPEPAAQGNVDPADKQAPADKGKKAEKDAEKASANADSKAVTHTVVNGDNPSVIAKKYGVSTEDVLRWNDLKKGQTLHLGQTLIIQPPAKKQEQDDPPPTNKARKKQKRK